MLSYDANSGIGKRHLVIKYSENDRRYYLRDLGDGSGTFVRVDNSKDLILKQGFIVSYGDSHMVVVCRERRSPPTVSSQAPAARAAGPRRGT